MSGIRSRVDTLVEDSIRQDTSAVPVPDRASWGGRGEGFVTLFHSGHMVPRTHLPTASSSLHPRRPVQRVCPKSARGEPPPGSAFLSQEPLVSSCSDSQPRLSSCQTGFFKNISVFTQHELISLQCVCVQAREHVPRAALLTLSSSVSVIFGSRGCKATFTPLSAGLRRDSRRSKSPLPLESGSPSR